MRKHLDLSQPIFAVASGSLPSAIAIVRLSGKDVFEIAQRLTSPPISRERGMRLTTLVDEEGVEFDRCLVLGFVAPDSHTGEDVVEFHCHGSRAIVSRLDRCLRDLGARPAERGEFSYRGLVLGKLSPEEIDRLGDAFLAREASELDRLSRRHDQTLLAQIAALREKLLRVQAVIDTAVDFADEYSGVLESAHEPVKAAIHECSVITQRYFRFSEGEKAPRVVLAGRPNAGKSSLFNSLLSRHRAIVSPTPGTTRDAIEDEVDLGGRRCKLVDTAGIRDASGAEAEGVVLGQEFLAASDAWVLVVDGTRGLDPEDVHLLERFGRKPHLVAWNKFDAAEWAAPPLPEIGGGRVIETSATAGHGIEEIWSALSTLLPRTAETEPLPTHVQATRLSTALSRLKELDLSFSKKLPPEYLSEEVRGVIQGISDVIGPVSVDDVLDRVFADFCIGK